MTAKEDREADKRKYWASTVSEPWRKLRVGDRIRIVRLPSGVDAPGYQFPACTRRLYERLIERGRPLRISWIDEWKHPWIECQFKHSDGVWHSHILSVDDDSWVRVKPRAQRKD